MGNPQSSVGFYENPIGDQSFSWQNRQFIATQNPDVSRETSGFPKEGTEIKSGYPPGDSRHGPDEWAFHQRNPRPLPVRLNGHRVLQDQ